MFVFLCFDFSGTIRNFDGITYFQRCFGFLIVFLIIFCQLGNTALAENILKSNHSASRVGDDLMKNKPYLIIKMLDV